MAKTGSLILFQKTDVDRTGGVLSLKNGNFLLDFDLVLSNYVVSRPISLKLLAKEESCLES